MMHAGESLVKVVLSFGSNCGDRIANIVNALEWFRSLATDCCFSSIYETPEIHGHGAPYMNAVGSGFVNADFDAFLRLTKLYEVKNGRDTSSRLQGKVPIDIDIVICDNDILRPLDFGCEFFQIGYKELLK